MKWMRQPLVLAFVASLGLLYGVGCAPEFEEATCQSDDECFSDEQCVEGVCRLGSGSTTDTGTEEAGEEGPVALVVNPEAVEVAVGRTVRLHAAVLDAKGNRLSGDENQWTSTKDDVAAVVSSGDAPPNVATVKGRAAGKSTITASLGELEATAEEIGVETPVHRISVTPSDAEIVVSNGLQLDATLYDIEENELSGRQVEWESADTNIATVDGEGVVTGKAVGETEIIANAEGKSGKATVEVIEPKVGSVQISPGDPGPLGIGGMATLVAQPIDRNGNAICSKQEAEGKEEPCGHAVTWTSGSPTIASVDETGSVTGKAEGTVRIFAEIEGFTASVEMEVKLGNLAPNADAGMDQTVTKGTTAMLDGNGSNDPNGDSLTYAWNLTMAPDGSSAMLGSNSGVTSSLTPDVSGTYVVELQVSDGNKSDTDTVEITATNGAPVADAGMNQSTVRGSMVTIDGGGSMDPDGDMLSYSWSLTNAPMNSSATLGSTSGQTTTLTPDVLGTYEIELTVDDGSMTDTDTVEVTATNQAPVADAGMDRTVTKGMTVTVDGSNSSDMDAADMLTYTWSLDASPMGSSATLGSTSGSSTMLTPDVAGDYDVKLTVDDGTDTDTATVTITATNQQPSAEAGMDTETDVSEDVTLDAGGSMDPDMGDTLTYSWSVTSKASGSATVTLGSPMAKTTSFSANVAGDYVIELTVDDQSGTMNATATDTVTVTVYGSPSTAGELVISEIMSQPDDLDDTNGEWFEIYNASTAPLNLEGCTIATPGGSTTMESTTISGDLRVAAGEYLTLAVGSSPGFMPDYNYSGALTLEDGGDNVTISCSSTQIDGVQYDGGTNFPSTVGAAMRLDDANLSATDNDTGTNWCDASSIYGTNDKGTPGSANGTCP